MQSNRIALDGLVAVLARIDLHRAHHADVTAILGEWPLDLHDLGDFGEHTNGRTVLYENAAFELLLAHWPAAGATPVHDHGGASCFTVVLEGKLRIDDFAIVSRAEGDRAHVAFMGSRLLGYGAVDVRASDLDLHRVCAVDGPALSLVLLTKPRSGRTVYDLKESSYRVEPIEAARECADIDPSPVTARPGSKSTSPDHICRPARARS